MSFKSMATEINNMDNNKTTYILPAGWIWTTIPELFVIIGGGIPASIEYKQEL